MELLRFIAKKGSLFFLPFFSCKELRKKYRQSIRIHFRLAHHRYLLLIIMLTWR